MDCKRRSFMFRQLSRVALVAGLGWSLGAGSADAQLYTVPSQRGAWGADLTSLRALQTAKLDSAIFQFYSEYGKPVLDEANSVSKLDLAAPKNARKEYEKGYLHLIRNEMPAAIDQ